MSGSDRKTFFAWLGVGCLATAALFGVIVFLIAGVAFKAMRDSEPYRFALQRARSDARVIAVLGEPIEARFWVGGSTSTASVEGRRTVTTELQIPIEGPKASAVIHVDAWMAPDGRWVYRGIGVRPDRGNTIDITPPRESTGTAPPVS